MSTASKAGGGSRASDEDGKTSVRVGMTPCLKSGEIKPANRKVQLCGYDRLSKPQILDLNSYRSDSSDLWCR